MIVILVVAGLKQWLSLPHIEVAINDEALLHLYSLFNLFAGFAITQPNMPGWWYAPVAVCLTVIVAQFLHICL